MLTAAFIGNGKSTNRYHLPFILKTKKFQVKTIFSPSGKSNWQKLDGVNYTSSINDILTDDGLDLVIITTPAEFHYENAKLALEHGKNVLLEKPFTMLAAEARDLFNLAKEKGVFLQAYQNRRLDSDFLTVQKVIESGKLGELLEVEMHYDYFRPEVPESMKTFSPAVSYLYGHACHTVDQVLSYFGSPDHIHYDVRQLLGDGRMNDYFDLDFYYANALKVSIKSSYFRIKARPSFVVYGKKGMFVKETKDRQEEDLKHFYMPDRPDFGLDYPEHYGNLTYIDEAGTYHEEKVVSEVGDYSQFYEKIYQSLVNGADKFVQDSETIRLIEILEEGISGLK
ncbi:NAD(P)-dependent oxidoreductase [Streptococcus chenjunshii]|uniref:NAD(P)-dependent oxidoreductase n=1 Tax=Streptococcus chenjunshii TaxID=2173853 RepID=A0A372KP69_9STRE|nr:Gfo/Idh/MocA family oxidoreductase [Streptococcus chenjunshii]AXQ78631.1 NAD(P)-dependent oxidoreductase [Streptococcus chenjunshii]RFU51905.1 NAD(P)-dependent oxidoreductase [Streptococcus chenjunshii]RFU54097.1 NAD(P)-dependent oxidoreductase [Streptococcus chenjunshii]